MVFAVLQSRYLGHSDVLVWAAGPWAVAKTVWQTRCAADRRNTLALLLVAGQHLDDKRLISVEIDTMIYILSYISYI